MFGRLGTGNEYDEPSPVLISFMPDAPKMKAVSGEEIDNFKGPTVPMVLGETEPKIVGIAAGAYHSLALTGLSQYDSTVVKCVLKVPEG